LETTKKHNILITGGNGFIGSQVALELHRNGHQVTIVDRVNKKQGVPGNIIVRDYLEFFNHTRIQYDTVVHLAADHQVEESVSVPEKFYTNNVVKMKGMLDRMIELGIKNIIFSSSGSVYGRQGSGALSLKEHMYFDPENAYASTKAAGEMLIKDYARAYGLKYVNFRYFNAAGADPDCQFGYTQRPATHVLPILCNKILNGEKFTIFGNDYTTLDGTCVRDYVHVADLANAHQKAIEFLNSGFKNETFNLGIGAGGVSVKELVNYASKVVGKEPVIEYAGRRAGDTAKLVADISKAKQMLDWYPKYNIEDIITHSWNWENKFETVK